MRATSRRHCGDRMGVRNDRKYILGCGHALRDQLSDRTAQEMILTTRGAKIYTGKPCRQGHSGERYASNRQCVECLRETKYRPEVNLKAVHRYYIANRGSVLEKNRQRRRKAKCLLQGKEMNVARSARALARAQGLKKFTGVSCNRGHSGLRYTCCGSCTACTIERVSQRRAPSPPNYKDNL
jgi:hypothetical protein